MISITAPESDEGDIGHVKRRQASFDATGVAIDKGLHGRLRSNHRDVA